MPWLSFLCGVKIIIHDVLTIVDRSLFMRVYHGQGLIKYSYGSQPNRNNRKCSQHSRNFTYLKWWLLCNLWNTNRSQIPEAMKRSEWIHWSESFSLEWIVNMGTIKPQTLRQDISWMKAPDQAREKEYSTWNDDAWSTWDRLWKDHSSQMRDHTSTRYTVRICRAESSNTITIMTYILWRLKLQRFEHINSWR